MKRLSLICTFPWPAYPAPCNRVASDDERHTAIFSYTEKPGVIGNVERTRQLFGRVLAIHRSAQRHAVRSDKPMDRQASVADDDGELDAAGKAVFDDIYAASDPRPYYRAMGSLDDSIPEEARPYFQQMFARCRNVLGRGRLRVLDLGASYGVNAALLK